MTVRNYTTGTVLARKERGGMALLKIESIHDNARTYSVTVLHEYGHRERLSGFRPDLPIERALFGYRVATQAEHRAFSTRGLTVSP